MATPHCRNDFVHTELFTESLADGRHPTQSYLRERARREREGKKRKEKLTFNRITNFSVTEYLSTGPYHLHTQAVWCTSEELGKSSFLPSASKSSILTSAEAVCLTRPSIYMF